MIAFLRSHTGSMHDDVDARFGRFDLATPFGYRDMLRAHARALGAVERALPAPGADFWPWRSRLDLLGDDLAALGSAVPEPLPFASPASEAEAFGMLYVLEGSRLGGQMIARTVPPALPTAYLGARHLRGEWQGLLAAIEARAEAGGGAWRDAAVAAASRTFALYAAAAG